MTKTYKSIWGYFVLCTAIFVWAKQSYSQTFSTRFARDHQRSPGSISSTNSNGKLIAFKLKGFSENKPLWNTKNPAENSGNPNFKFVNMTTSKSTDAPYAIGASLKLGQ